MANDITLISSTSTGCLSVTVSMSDTELITAKYITHSGTCTSKFTRGMAAAVMV